MKPLNISYVIIEYKSIYDVKKCINSIREKSKNLLYEIVVSSNSNYSSENKRSILKKFHGIKWIFNDKNLGFAKAMNIGIYHTSGEIVVITNPDVMIYEGSLQSAYEYLIGHEDVGIIGPKIIDNNGNLEDSCRKFMTPLDWFIRTLKRIIFRKDILLNSRFNYNEIQIVDWVIGAFMIVKRKAMEIVGLLDEEYFLYVEDMDWCKRFWDCGFKVVYYPKLVVKYKGDRKSTLPLIKRCFINKYSIYHFKSYLRFIKKHWIKLV